MLAELRAEREGIEQMILVLMRKATSMDSTETEAYFRPRGRVFYGMTAD